ncbi:MAG: 2-oxoacid:acceptor oxidoreductase subunit alpha [Dehalococcoidia bacterium]|jgi:2-oxoglutarate ferredoxin oxidoreductase subunit alpha
MAVDINILVGGEAGQGVQSVGLILSKTFTRGGYHIFTDQDFESRIRGGHSFCRVRVKETDVQALSEQVHLVVALNKETIDLHRAELVEDGLMLLDREGPGGTDKNLFEVPMSRLAKEKAGDPGMANSVGLGSIMALTGYDMEILSAVFKDHFKKADIVERNIKAASAGYQYIKDNFKGQYTYKIAPQAGPGRMVLDGNEAVALGAIAAGCKFVAGYPMTPTTPILEYLAFNAAKMNMVVVEAEDEISAINMIIGAGYAGARAMTATSGGGFCLMVEGFGLAGMTETPIVVIYGQRAGPAIGLPTRTEQGDLQFVLHASHGEFPRVVFAPATVEEAFWLTARAFNMAEKYQGPAVVMIDHYLADAYSSVNRFDLSKISIDRGLLLSTAEMKKAHPYQRHKYTKTGISPRGLPMYSEELVVTDSDEHDEDGHMIEDAETRKLMVEKRMRKLFSIRQDIAQPHLYGPKKASTTLVGWGSTYGPLKEAVDMLHSEKVDVNLLHYSEVWPLDKQPLIDAASTAKQIYTVENNFTGQFADLIAQETGKMVNGRILKWDGRPFSPAYIVREFKKMGCC